MSLALGLEFARRLFLSRRVINTLARSRLVMRIFHQFQKADLPQFACSRTKIPKIDSAPIRNFARTSPTVTAERIMNQQSLFDQTAALPHLERLVPVIDRLHAPPIGCGPLTACSYLIISATARMNASAWISF